MQSGVQRTLLYTAPSCLTLGYPESALVLAAHTAKLLAGVEMPEPTIIKDMGWYENEVYDIGDLQQYAAAAAAQARVKALDEAKQACLQKHANGNWKHDTREECADAIEELKGGAEP